MESFVDYGDEPHGDIVDGKFLVTGAQAAILLVPANHALHDVPAFVGLLVEVLVAGLVLARRDHCLDLAALAPAPNARVTVAPVSRQPQRPSPSALAAVEQPPGQGRLEELALVTLPRRDVDGNNESVAVTYQMDFRPEAASRTPERMVRWFLEL